MISVVREGNLVAVPPQLAQEFDLHEGSRVNWIRSEEGSWTLQPARTPSEIARELMGAGAKYIKPGASGVENFIRWREEDAKSSG